MTTLSNVIQFKGSNAKISPEQSDLFSFSSRFARRFSIIDVRTVNQERFRSILTRNSVVGVVDLRSYPLFEAPEFNHKSIIDFMRVRDVDYFPLFPLIKRDRARAVRPWAERGRLKIEQGMFLVVFDGVKTQAEQVVDARMRLIRSGRMIELHPRSLAY